MCVGMHMDFPSTKNLQACTDWTSYLLCSNPHSLDQPEGFLGCHSPNRKCLVWVLPIT